MSKDSLFLPSTKICIELRRELRWWFVGSLQKDKMTDSLVKDELGETIEKTEILVTSGLYDALISDLQDWHEGLSDEQE